MKNEDNVEEESNKPDTFLDPDFEKKDNKPHRMCQVEWSELIQDLDLSREKAELIGSRLQQLTFLQRNESVSHYR